MWGSLILLILVILLIALIPTWPYSRRWGYYPGGAVAVLLVFWLVLIWFGYVVLWYPWAPTPVVVE